jgi:hypothetical protein
MLRAALLQAAKLNLHFTLKQRIIHWDFNKANCNLLRYQMIYKHSIDCLRKRIMQSFHGFSRNAWVIIES